MTTDTGTVTNETETAEEDEDNTSTSIMVSTPLGLKNAIKSAAEADSETVSSFIRKVMAERVGYEKPLGLGRKRLKYKTEAERIAVTKARQNAKRQLMKELMQKYETELNERMQAEETQARAKVSGGNSTNASEDASEAESEDVSPAQGTPQPPRQFDAE